MSKLWSIQPLAPPPSPLEYLKAFAKSPDPIVAAAASAQPTTAFGISTFYESYLHDHNAYVAAHRELNDELHVSALSKKLFKEKFSTDKELSMASVPGNQHPSHAAVSGMWTGSTTNVRSPASIALVYKPRVKQTPPPAKPLVVIAKNALRKAKTDAKVASLAQQAATLKAASEEQRKANVTKATYASVLAKERSDRTAGAAKIVAQTQFTRVLSKRDKAEARRVRLYTRNGGAAAMPPAPQGDFLVAPRNEGPVRVKSVTTTGPNGVTEKTVTTATNTNRHLLENRA